MGSKILIMAILLLSSLRIVPTDDGSVRDVHHIFPKDYLHKNSIVDYE